MGGDARTLYAVERPLLWVGGLLAIFLFAVSATLLWSRPLEAPKPAELIARAEAIGDCKAALRESGELVGIFDVTALPDPAIQTAVLVSGRALFRVEGDSVISPYFHCGYDVARGGVVKTQLGRR